MNQETWSFELTFSEDWITIEEGTIKKEDREAIALEKDFYKSIEKPYQVEYRSNKSCLEFN